MHCLACLVLLWHVTETRLVTNLKYHRIAIPVRVIIPFPSSKLKKSLLMYWNWMQYQIYLSCRIFLAVFFFIYLPPKVDSSLLKVYWWWWSTLWRLIEIPKKNSATLFFLNRESNPKDLDRQSYMLTARPTKQPCLGFFPGFYQTCYRKQNLGCIG